MKNIKKVPLACEMCGIRNYTVNNSLINKRLLIKKYCMKCKEHTLHKEEK
ncbi:50S ribosomal protein L33 [Mycoplasma phocimorsus]|nr:50S ribosomal protein L33 [Mycoplasma phocimorsus]MDJ1646351.1 50S ribosomal protein L33 [Mycoplasma phocimorsus]MDJ1647084.1 50S ribosomal protein L33 [Mycoplasma phocimorsus]MDJ1647524.1 50S ribosomal protein L33 [Mycoplasma phocimorsus]MDJ1648142.1 50S ribosomal protein L33 [Mycoplasma phocimorsus]MDJ1649169.1 50S ribosomal protein L33 [Mycoplasma phocimorsus]